MLILHNIFLPDMAAKRKTKQVDPDFLQKQKASLVRKNRTALYFNDRELAAINAYCEKFKIHSKSALFREAIMEKVISQLEDNHPTLF